jgi:hypothetical protein
MPRASDFEPWNLTLVAEGIRPAWMGFARDRARVERAAKRRGLFVSADLRLDEDTVVLLVTKKPLRSPRADHLYVGKALGLPCASGDPWGEGAAVYVSVGLRRPGAKVAAAAVPRPRKRAYWRVSWTWPEPHDDGSLIITTFLCTSADRAAAWCRDLVARMASNEELSRMLRASRLEPFYVVLQQG